MSLISKLGIGTDSQAPKTPAEAEQPGPAPSDTEVWTWAEESTAGIDRAAFWVGMLVGAVLLLIAYGAHIGLVGIDAFADYNPTVLDGYWAELASLGSLVSVIALNFSIVMREKLPRPRLIMSLTALGISTLMTALYVLDYYGALTGLLSSPDEFVWPDGKPAWFFALCAAGVCLAQASLVLASGGTNRDRVVGVVGSLVPLALMSLPMALSMGDAELMRFMPTLFFVSGISLMLSGMRLPSKLSDLPVADLAGPSSKALFGALLVVAVLIGLGWSSSGEWVWAIPLFATVFVSLVVFAAHVPSLRTRQGGGIGLLLSWCALGILVHVSSRSWPWPTSMPFRCRVTNWLFPLSVLGMTVVMATAVLSGTGTRIDKSVGLAVASLPLLVLAWMAASFEDRT